MAKSLLKRALRKIKKVTESLLIIDAPTKSLVNKKESVTSNDLKNKPAQGQSDIPIEEKVERKFTKSQKKIMTQSVNILSTIPKLSYTEIDGVQEGPTYSWGDYTLSYRNNNFLRGVTNRTVRSTTQHKNVPFP
ncbi:DNA-directed RNA polymerase subunit beta [Acrasis kona]|uniref:DNA-directed RNA polymerase subunit beta n=1 Tax=Acrasis kona TaxID=1008807 RepID=A0AAW2Z408_9EUKA